jgi:hypothetical protein
VYFPDSKASPKGNIRVIDDFVLRENPKVFKGKALFPQVIGNDLLQRETKMV